MLDELMKRGAVGSTLTYDKKPVDITQGKYKSYPSSMINTRFSKGNPSKLLLDRVPYELDSVVNVPGVNNMSIGYVGSKPIVIPSNSDAASKAAAKAFNEKYAGHKQKGRTVYPRYHFKENGGYIIGDQITIKDPSGNLVSGVIKDIKDGEIYLED